MPVPIKNEARQAVIQLHRLREQWKSTRAARINSLRGALRGFSIDLPAGAVNAIQHAPGHVDPLSGHSRIALQAVLRGLNP